MADGELVVLTGGTFITVKSADLAPGRTATLTLQFQNAGEVTLQTTVVDGTEGQWASVTPSSVELRPRKLGVRVGLADPVRLPLQLRLSSRTCSPDRAR